MVSVFHQRIDSAQSSKSSGPKPVKLGRHPNGYAVQIYLTVCTFRNL